ncbi:lactose-binding lectin l-2-like [Pecten maximus]|uniref:lactose-binding lectin l-2-like n=1 Tax=Pecten maximus TaxID=6579 RepID=UPI00145804E8|nr:lactose-binding lectin l-2-like [Pecten maximus]
MTNNVRLFTDSKTWSEAQDECKNHDSNLVTIETQEENTWLKGIQFTQNNPWIGAYTDDARTVWRWVSDNSTLTYTDWRPGEPNDVGGNEDCVHLKSDGWNDGRCSIAFAFICEKQG